MTRTLHMSYILRFDVDHLRAGCVLSNKKANTNDGYHFIDKK